jgi:hypothetical protein
VFCQHRPLPSELMTAVAFEVWDDICGIFGRYESIMRVLGRVLKGSVYLEAGRSDVDPAADAVLAAASVREYAQLTPYFKLHRGFESEKSHLTQIIDVRK